MTGNTRSNTAFRLAYHHNNKVVAGETCPTGSSSIAGLAFEFYSGGPYPASYDGALFFADYSRDCIWVMKKDANGIPAPGLLETFVAPAANPVDIQISPAGELFYVDFDGGAIRRIQYVSANQPPVAVATANPTSGSAPLTVNFNGTSSSDPDGDAITYAWDLDGDGLYDDSTAASRPTPIRRVGVIRRGSGLPIAAARRASAIPSSSLPATPRPRRRSRPRLPASRGRLET